MESNLSRGQRFPHISEWVISSSCLPIHKKYSHLPLLEYNNCSRSQKAQNKWQKLVRRLARQWKGVYGHKGLTFQYDADSYARNFDEGVQSSEEPEPRSRVQDSTAGALQVDQKGVHEPI